MVEETINYQEYNERYGSMSSNEEMEIENEIGGTGGRVGVGDSKARGEKKGSHFIVATGKDYSGKGV